MKPNRKIEGFLCSDHGIAAVEFAILAPVLVLFCGFALDVGRAFNSQMRITSATSAAAQYAFQNGQSLTAGSVAATLSNIAAVARSAPNLSPAPVVTVALNNASDSRNLNNFYCVTGKSPSTWTWVSTGTSSSTCGNSVVSGKFITISVTGTTNSIFLSAPIAALFSSQTDFAIVQVQ